jgi:hypothetical protein
MGKHGQVFDPSTADPIKGERPDKKSGFDPSTAKVVKEPEETTTQKVVGTAASILDLVAGGVPFVARTVDEVSGTINRLVLSTINPDIHAGTAAQDAVKDAHEHFDRFFGGYGKMVDLLYKDKHIVDKSAAQQIQNHIGEMLAKPIEYTEKHFGKEAASYVQEMEDGLMILGPAKAAEVVKGLKGKVADIKTAPEHVPEGDLAKQAEDIKTATKVNPPAEEPSVPPPTEGSVEAPKRVEEPVAEITNTTERSKQESLDAAWNEHMKEAQPKDLSVREKAFLETFPEFKDSVIKDEEGRLVTLYHGTNTHIPGGVPTKGRGLYGSGVYLAEGKVRAGGYAKSPEGGTMYPAHVNLKNPISEEQFVREFGKKSRTPAEDEQIRQTLIDRGYDGLVMKFGNKYHEVVVFDPKNVKSAISPLKGTKDLFKEKGQANVKVLAGMALVSGAATAGYIASPEGQKVEGAVLAGIGSIVLAGSLPKAASLLKNDFRKAVFKAALPTSMVAAGVYYNPDRKIEGALAGLGLWGWGELPAAKSIQSGDLFRVNYNNKIAMERLYTNMANKIKVKIPDQTRRVEVISAYEKGTLDNIKLQPHEKEVVDAWKSMMDSFAVAAKDAGIMSGFIENYVPHIVEKLGQDGLAAQVKDLLGFSQDGAGGSRRFTKERKYDTFQELNAALEGSGLQVKTMDPSEILPIYGRAMTKAIEDKNLIEGLKGAAVAGDKLSARLVQPTDKAPSDYKSIEGISILNGLRVHPEIVDPLKVLLKGRTTNELAKAAVNVNAAIKRLGVSFSLFHGKSLIEAALLAGGRKAVSPDGVKAALYMFHNGGLGDNMDFLIREGGLVMKHPSDVDVQSIEKVGKLVDELTGTKIAGKTAKKFDAVQSKVDRLTWEIAHTGLKGNLALTLLHQWDSTKSFMGKDFSNLTREQAARQISSFINDTFGGLNWYQVFEESRTAMGRKLAAGLLNPKGRDMLQLAIFAPDWTLSTLRAWYKAIPGYSGDLNNVLAAKYVMRTAIIYGGILNAANYALVGRPIWDNKDKTRLDLPDGRSMQVIKHSAEATELLQNPSKFLSNKLSFFPQAGLIALGGKAYLNGPPVDSKLAAILGKVEPFGAQSMLGTTSSSLMNERMQRAIAGEFGFGLYGQTKEDKMERIRQQARKARKEAKRKSTQ